MITVRVKITGGDRKVGAMAKAIAVETSGFESVKGTTKEFLKTHGYYDFAFPTSAKAGEFRDTTRMYIPITFAEVIDQDQAKGAMG